MKYILVDTSIWIDYFSGKIYSFLLNKLIDRNLICVNNLILSELVPFLRHKKQYDLVDLLYSVKNIPVSIEWDKIINYQQINLKNGINKVGIPDLIILQNVIDNNLELFTHDKHFSLIHSHITFSLYKSE